jgi:hypothetical protein
MKWTALVCLFFMSLCSYGQDSLLAARLKTLQGKIVSFSSIEKKDSLFLICFWSATSEESITELNAFNVNLENWQKMKPFRFLAVSVDEGKAAGQLRPLYNQNEWTFEAFVDLYGDMRRALHSNNLPQSVIVYKNEVIYEQSGWTAGSENYLIQKIFSIKN